VLDPEDDSTVLRSDLSDPVTVALYPERPRRHTATRSVKDEEKFDVSVQIKKDYSTAIYKLVTTVDENVLKINFIFLNILHLSKYYFSRSL